MKYDFCIIGGGIVGCATAYKILEKNPGASLLLLEKEPGPGMHQTGHNSGVIHAGIYYAPGSMKAKLCREGLKETKSFCIENNIKFDECGKLIVAQNKLELSRLDDLFQRATVNGLALTKLTQGELGDLEPNIVGMGALLSPETGIVSYREICDKLAELVIKQNADVHYNVIISSIKEKLDYVEIIGNEKVYTATRLIVCGGVQADRLARLSGLDPDFKIIPFRGEYYQLAEKNNSIIRHLIYPAPDPALPFLGIHLTRMIDGSVTVGPNAVLGLSRDGYEKLSFSIADALDFVTYPGFWRLLFKYPTQSFSELRNSLSKSVYLRECQKYCPILNLDDLLPCRAGIRAQLVTRKGELVHDFVFQKTSRMLHVLNAPSPAATSALPIGSMIVNML
jgi:L-2-hydroxyglutarate oxidase